MDDGESVCYRCQQFNDCEKNQRYVIEFPIYGCQRIKTEAGTDWAELDPIRKHELS